MNVWQATQKCLQLTPSCTMILLRVSTRPSPSPGERPRDSASLVTEGPSAPMSSANEIVAPVPSGRVPIQATGSLGYFERRREFWARAQLRRVGSGVGTRSDAHSHSRNLCDFLQLPVLCSFVESIVHVVLQLFVDLYGRVISATSDGGGGSTCLGYDLFLGHFRDVVPRTGFNLFAVFGPEASLELIKVCPQGVESGFESIFMGRCTFFEVLELQRNKLNLVSDAVRRRWSVRRTLSSPL